LELLQALRGRRRPITAAELAKTLEVSERTIYRDIATLTARGAPVAGEAGVGYVLKPGLFLPPLMFTVDEVEAVVLGLRYVDQRGDAVLTKAAAVALAKIESVLTGEGQAALAAPLTMPGPPSSFPENAVPLADLRAAIRGQRRLEIDYVDGHGRGSHRTVRPIQLGFMDSARVLGAWCEERRAFRNFRTDRILSATDSGRYPGRRADLLRDFRTYMSSREHPAPDRN
jgi:predicted DNA-binding transcriptional regulator YafY